MEPEQAVPVEQDEERPAEIPEERPEERPDARSEEKREERPPEENQEERPEERRPEHHEDQSELAERPSEESMGFDAESEREKPTPKNPGVCPSVRKGEACWALSRGKPCHYAIHGPNAGDVTKTKSANVYVCHLPASTTKEQLEAIFSPYGEISAVDMLIDNKTKENKGVAFIHFVKPEDAQSAIAAIDGLLLNGVEKALECRLAKPNPKNGPRGEMAEDDWECGDPACAYVNWARRSTCNKCGAPKAERRRPPPRRYSRYDDDYGPPRRRDYDDYPPRRSYYDEYDYGGRDYGRYGPPPGRYGPPPPGRWGGPRPYDSYGPGPAYDPYGPDLEPGGYPPYGPPGPGRPTGPPRDPYYGAPPAPY